MILVFHSRRVAFVTELLVALSLQVGVLADPKFSLSIRIRACLLQLIADYVLLKMVIVLLIIFIFGFLLFGFIGLPNAFA